MERLGEGIARGLLDRHLMRDLLAVGDGELPEAQELQEVEEQITALGVVRSRLQERITHFQRVKTTESFRNTDSFSSPKKREDYEETLMS